MNKQQAKEAYGTLVRRTWEVARLQSRCRLGEGLGRLIVCLALPLLLVLVLEHLIGLAFYLRAPVLPALAVGLLVLAWRWMLRPWLRRPGLYGAALIVERARPDLKTQLITALQVYPDLQNDSPHFDEQMVAAVVVQTQEKTRTEDFRTAVDRRPMYRFLGTAGGVVVMWIAAFAIGAGAMGSALGQLASAWQDVRNVVQKLAGARIEIEALEKDAYLVGAKVVVRARQHGFHSEQMEVYTRARGTDEWQQSTVPVDAQGQSSLVIPAATNSFEIYFAHARIVSNPVLVNVTEQPRIVSLSVEYELPEYTRRAPILQVRSDGNLRAVYGTSVILSIESNKALQGAVLRGSFSGKPLKLTIGGKFARGLIRLTGKDWLSAARQKTVYTYTLELRDEFGFSNGDAAHKYSLAVEPDLGPRIGFIGLPHRSSADEPHVLEDKLDGIAAIIRAGDDWGVAGIKLHYRLEDLESGAEKKHEVKEHRFPMPRPEVRQLLLLRLSEIGAKVGDRIVFWAEAEDAYDLEPETGPHKSRTPVYRVAVVAEEGLFDSVVYRDDWSTQWYDSIKVASLSKREIPPRLAPATEPAAKVAAKLLEAPAVTNRVPGNDRQLIRAYFETLNVVRGANE